MAVEPGPRAVAPARDPPAIRRNRNSNRVTVAVVIVNWNGGDLLRECLDSLDRQTRRPDRIIVVDNASTDGSLTRAGLERRRIQLIRLDKNAGFAEANNI